MYSSSAILNTDLYAILDIAIFLRQSVSITFSTTKDLHFW